MPLPTQAQVNKLVLDVVKANTPDGSTMVADSKFDDYGVPSQSRANLYFGPIKKALEDAGVPSKGLTADAFATFSTVKQLQTAVWLSVVAALAEPASSALQPHFRLLVKHAIRGVTVPPSMRS